MTLEEFEKDVQETLKGFVRVYEEENRKDPVNWLLEMDEGEWWDQFIGF